VFTNISQNDVALRRGSDSFVFAPKLTWQWVPEVCLADSLQSPAAANALSLCFCMLKPLCVVYLCAISKFLVLVEKFAVVLSVDSSVVFCAASYLPNGIIRTHISQLHNVTLGRAMIDPISSRYGANISTLPTIASDQPESPFKIKSGTSRVSVRGLLWFLADYNNWLGVYMRAIMVSSYLPGVPLALVRCAVTLSDLSKRWTISRANHIAASY